MSGRRRPRPKHPSKALSLSATDADWAVMKEKAERRRLSISRYAVALVLGGGWDARDGPALVLANGGAKVDHGSGGTVPLRRCVFRSNPITDSGAN